MTVEEFAKLKLYVEGAYNNFQVSSLVWYDMLKELDYKICFDAVKNVIKVAKYPLSIAAIIEEYNTIVKSKMKEETNYLLDVANEMLDKDLISFDLHCEIELEISYEEFISEKNKQILLAYKKDRKLLEILNGKEQQLCLIDKRY